MHDRPVIRELHGDGGTIRGIAREQRASRNAVRRALAPGARDRYYRRSLTEGAEPAVREVLADYPHMSVADIVLIIDWRHSRRTLSDLVARLRPEYSAHSPIAARAMSELQVGVLSTAEIRYGTLTLGEVVLDQVQSTGRTSENRPSRGPA